MGCDIHLFTERKRTIDDTEKWVNCDNWILNPYHKENYPDNGPKYELNSLYKDRNYLLFSLLADVRNYSENTPISQPKGLPEDVSQVVKEISDRWDSDGHSHSWFLFSEIKAFAEVNPKIKASGFVSPQAAEKFDLNGETPNEYAQGVSKSLGWVHRKWEYDSPIIGFCNRIKQRIIDQFCYGYERSYKPEEMDDKFRIVFFFDN